MALGDELCRPAGQNGPLPGKAMSWKKENRTRNVFDHKMLEGLTKASCDELFLRNFFGPRMCVWLARERRFWEIMGRWKIRQDVFVVYNSLLLSIIQSSQLIKLKKYIFMNKCLYENVPFQTLSLSGTAFSDWILFRNCLFRFDPFQDVPCQTWSVSETRVSDFFWVFLPNIHFTLPKQIHRGSTRKTPFPSGFHVHSWTMAEL